MSRVLSLGEALETLASPLRVEALSHAVGGEGVLVVALEMPADPRSLPSGELLEATRRALAELPCPAIGVRRAALAGGLATWARGLDCVVVDAEEGTREDESLVCTLAPVLRAVRANPHAALALVQLIRHGQGMELHEALIAESLAYSTLQSGPEFARWLAGRGAPKQRPVPPEPAVVVTRRAERLEVELNRPAKRNAYSAEMRDALCEALAIAEADPAIERVTLRGRGPAFCSGGDLDEFGTLPDPASAHVVRSTRSAGRMLTHLRDRVSAEVHGACVGAGVELPAFAGRVVAAPDARFQLPEVAMGLVPGAGGTASLPRRIGRQRTVWLGLSGVAIDARTALQWDLVDAIEPDLSEAAASEAASI